MMEKKLGITMGDPAGIGPEIIARALAQNDILDIGKLILFGDQKVMEEAIKIVGVDLDTNLLREDFNNYQDNKLNIYDMDNVDVSELNLGEVQGEAGLASYQYIEKASEMALANKIDAVVTGPINKEALKAGDVDYIGHTEMLGDLTDTAYPLTMFEVHSLRIFFLTRHVSLRQACEQITTGRVMRGIRESAKALNKLGVENPEMAVAALNPHAGEHGLFGREEVDEIEPAVEKAKNEGYRVEGPVPADSVFHFALEGYYDAVLSLYHDQGHIAAKMVDFEKTVSITNNLPFLRTSVDHGTAFDIAGTGKASSVSMEEAIRVAAKYVPYFAD